MLPPLAAELPGVIVLKARGMNMAVAGDVSADPWDEEALTAGAVNGRARLQIAQWADPEHGRYVKMTTRAGVLEGLVAVGMPRTAAELVQLFERGAELPADRSLLLRLDGPDQAASAGAADPERTVCRCAGVSGTKIAAAVTDGCGTVAEVSAPPAPARAAAAAMTTSRGSSRRTFRGPLPEPVQGRDHFPLTVTPAPSRPPDPPVVRGVALLRSCGFRFPSEQRIWKPQRPGVGEHRHDFKTGSV